MFLRSDSEALGSCLFPCTQAHLSQVQSESGALLSSAISYQLNSVCSLNPPQSAPSRLWSFRAASAQPAAVNATAGPWWKGWWRDGCGKGCLGNSTANPGHGWVSEQPSDEAAPPARPGPGQAGGVAPLWLTPSTCWHCAIGRGGFFGCVGHERRGGCCGGGAVKCVKVGYSALSISASSYE